VRRGQRLLLEDIETGPRDLARAQRGHEVVEARGTAAADVDEERAALHPLEARAVHEALGGRRVGHCQHHEVGEREQRIERVRSVQLPDAGRRVTPARVHAGHVHPEGLHQPRRFGADAAHADDQRGGVGQVDDAARFPALRAPFTLELPREVVVKAARERQDERHDVRADEIVVDLAEVRDRDRMRDQRGRVVSGRRRRLRRLEPPEPRGLAEQAVGDGAEGGLGVADDAGGVRLGLGDGHRELGDGGGEARGPLASLVRLRRQHQECRRHGARIPRDLD
jgi:hypothetical protein